MDLHVVWSGALERQSAEAARRPARAVQADGALTHQDLVLACLRECGPMSVPQLAEAIEMNQQRINSALHHLLRKGLVAVATEMQPVRTQYGRWPRFYRAVALP